MKEDFNWTRSYLVLILNLIIQLNSRSFSSLILSIRSFTAHHYRPSRIHNWRRKLGFTIFKNNLSSQINHHCLKVVQQWLILLRNWEPSIRLRKYCKWWKMEYNLLIILMICQRHKKSDSYYNWIYSNRDQWVILE